ncbi:MAG: DUF4186 domain-containing protein [Zymomonas mobilis subsp. pomaceae]|uniref:Cytoplasmic protein n=1 Tax=Zymomonas mobilis subsp. pomaceae (strain ATCC 29192 / DSM 22645 / JCM 10191 / CCUG 17912 / NBRC 13757 / NCIMB 11200 / NRRL B-4491 / Barker I) TaxID=579138 RepID=F8EUF5_ZYMMT|nr:DUF4186 domain-containing protein [Zymomonas mobilis]AEI37171.1 hypothetical protein Zymop_0268 [Zymomonas mobilis subsp. pomaceae ATCC 29192]MDX5948541.1 DUF4186 domain-containing protein [Zymomonas mobilis subsp. pomaceae]GEB89849.1 hypothetical protein ZMO02_14860 [Zymomonas mobilis subsp. pomaceae]
MEDSLVLLFKRLGRSSFRRRFRLGFKEKQYFVSKGRSVILEHGKDFIEKRLAPATISNDGKQTPYKGHPVFLAQHATGTCCRGCLHKWHNIEPDKTLTEDEQRYILKILAYWLDQQITPEDSHLLQRFSAETPKSLTDTKQGNLF